MALAATATHTKALISPDSGSEDKVYGSDYVSPTSHSVALVGIAAVSQGGTGVASGTAGGLLYFATGATISDTGTYPADAVLVGSGAGAPPSYVTAGVPNDVLRFNGGGSLGFGTITTSSITGLATVATTGAYSDLSGKPSLGAVIGGTLGSVLYVGAGPIVAEDNANFKWGTTAGQGLTLNAGTATTDVQALAITQTWNNAAITYTGIKYTITNTASAADAMAVQILGGVAGTTTLFSVDKIGVGFVASDFVAAGLTPPQGVFCASKLHSSANVWKDGPLGWVGGADVTGVLDTGLSRISAGLVGVGTGAGASFAGNLKLTTLTADGLIVTKGYTVATLPAGVAGAIAHVTDQLTVPAAKGAAPTGGGNVTCPVFYNGAAWVGA